MLGLLEATLIELDLTDVEHVDGVHDNVAGSGDGRLRPLVQLERLVPLAEEVGEHAEHIEHARLALEILELFEKGERAEPVDRLLQLAELHLGVVDEPEGVGEGLFVPTASAWATARVLHLRARWWRPSSWQHRRYQARSSARCRAASSLSIPLRMFRPFVIQRSTRISVEPGLDSGELERETGLGHGVVIDKAPRCAIGSRRLT